MFMHQHSQKQWVNSVFKLDLTLSKCQAILAGHGFKEHDAYDPLWRRVHVPDAFLSLMAPMAEEIHASIVGALM